LKRTNNNFTQQILKKVSVGTSHLSTFGNLPQHIIQNNKRIDQRLSSISFNKRCL